MANQALTEALSPEKSPSLSKYYSNFSNGSSSSSFSISKPVQALPYLSSPDNIARLLKDWMKTKNPPNSIRTSSSVSQDSLAGAGIDSKSSCDQEINNYVYLSGAFEPMFGLEHLEPSNSKFPQAMSPDGTLFPDENKADYSRALPLSLLGNWLFDETATE